MVDFGGKETGYEVALKRAWGALAIEDLSPTAGVAPCDNGIALKYFSREYRVEPANHSIRNAEGDEPPLTRRILLLHYLLGTKNARLTGHEIGFAQIPGAEGYLHPFSGRVLLPLTGMFDRAPEKTAATLERLGAEKLDFATWCCKIEAFALVPLRIIYWRGDDEVTSGGQIVFDSGVGGILAVEDVVVLCEDMLKLLRERA